MFYLLAKKVCARVEGALDILPAAKKSVCQEEGAVKFLPAGKGSVYQRELCDFTIRGSRGYFTCWQKKCQLGGGSCGFRYQPSPPETGVHCFPTRIFKADLVMDGLIE